MKYVIASEYKGKDCWTAAPEYRREDGGKFVLDDKLSQKDLKYLFELGYPGVFEVTDR